MLLGRQKWLQQSSTREIFFLTLAFLCLSPRPRVCSFVHLYGYGCFFLLQTMLLLRLCPIIPFNGLNYLGGVTSVSLEDYTKALIGILPITLLWTAIGASADSLSNRQTDEVGEQVFFFFLLFFGIICGFTGIARIYRYARDELRKEIEFDRAESWRKYKRSLSTASGAAASSSSSKSVSSSEAMRDPVVEEGIEVLNRADMTLLAVLGIDGFAVEAQRPPECQDDDPFWYWA